MMTLIGPSSHEGVIEYIAPKIIIRKLATRSKLVSHQILKGLVVLSID